MGRRIDPCSRNANAGLGIFIGILTIVLELIVVLFRFIFGTVSKRNLLRWEYGISRFNPSRFF